MAKNKLYLLKIMCILFLTFSTHAIISIANASVVAYTKQIEPNNNRTIIDEDNARMQIDALGGAQTKLIFLLHGTPGQLGSLALRNTLVDKLNNILNPPTGMMAIPQVGSTTIDAYISGNNNDADRLSVCNANNRTSVQYGYSQTNLNSDQGQFIIDNGFLLYHTEPKAISELLDQIDNTQFPGDLPFINALLISRKPMCHCCARLLLDILNHRRSMIQNIIVMSHAIDLLRKWN